MEVERKAVVGLTPTAAIQSSRKALSQLRSSGLRVRSLDGYVRSEDPSGAFCPIGWLERSGMKISFSSPRIAAAITCLYV